MNIKFAVNVVMVINITIYKAFIYRDLVNKLFITKTSLAEEHISMFFSICKSRCKEIYADKKFKKKVRHNHCNLSIYVMIIHILIII